MSYNWILDVLDFTMNVVCNLGPNVTLCTLFVIVTYFTMCLGTTSAFEDENEHGPTYVIPKSPTFEEDHDYGPTYFIPKPTNITYKVGQTAKLQCAVENLGKKFIIWRKRSNPSPISIGELIYSPEKKYNTSFSPARREYDLLIHNVQPNDAGLYECAVSTREKLIRFIRLKVIGRQYSGVTPGLDLTNQNTILNPSHIPPYIMPEIILKGKQYVNSGETISLTCNVSGIIDVPQDLDWFKDGNLLRQFNRVSIHKDSSIAKRKLDSLLEIRNSKPSDAGTYVCRNSELLIASQKVIVLNEEKSNPDKRGTAGDAKSGQICNRQWWALFISTFVSIVITKGFVDLR